MCVNMSLCFGVLMDRTMVACGVPFDDGDSGADDTDVAVCVQRDGLGNGVCLFDCYGCGYFLRLLSNVPCAGSL